MKKVIYVFALTIMLFGCNSAGIEFSNQTAAESVDGAVTKAVNVEGEEHVANEDHVNEESTLADIFYYEEIDKHITANFEMPKSVSDSFIYRAHKEPYDVYTLWERFFPHLEVEEYQNVEKYNIMILESSDGCSISAQPGYYVVNTAKGILYQGMGFEYYFWLTDDDSYGSEEVEFMSPAEAEDVIAGYITPSMGDLSIFRIELKGVSQDDFQKRSIEIKNKEYLLEEEEVSANYSWSEADECYYFNVYFQLNGIPLPNQTKMLVDGMDAPGFYAQGILSKDGIEFLTMGEAFCQILEMEKSELIPFEDIYETFKSVVANLIVSEPFLMHEVSLKYVAEPSRSEADSLEIIPVWQFLMGMSKENGSFADYYTFLFDARTGKQR